MSQTQKLQDFGELREEGEMETGYGSFEEVEVGRGGTGTAGTRVEGGLMPSTAWTASWGMPGGFTTRSPFRGQSHMWFNFDPGFFQESKKTTLSSQTSQLRKGEKS